MNRKEGCEKGDIYIYILGKRTVEIHRSVDFLELDVLNNGSNIASSL
jgi:hypothetical protein